MRPLDPPGTFTGRRDRRRTTEARALAAALLAAALGAPVSAARAESDLFIYNWTDYTAPALIQKFEKETGIKVTVDTYDSNETLLAKLKAGGAGYDVVVVSSDFVKIFVDEKLIQRIDARGMPDFANVEARWRGPIWDRDNAYTVPYDWGVTSFAVDTKYIKGPVDSLQTLFEPPPEAKGRVGMLSSPSEVMSAAELYLGLAPCQTDTAAMKRVSGVLETQAPSVKVYQSDGAIERTASAETWVTQIWNGDASRARLANPDIRFVFPKEGVVGWMDNLAIPADARNPDNARRFLAFMLKPENAALTENFIHFASPIAGVEPYLDKAVRDAPELRLPDGENVAFTPTCPSAAVRLADRVWTRLRR